MSQQCRLQPGKCNGDGDCRPWEACGADHACATKTVGGYYLQAPAHWCFRVSDWLVYGLEVLSMAINLISIGDVVQSVIAAKENEISGLQEYIEGLSILR